MNVNVSALWIWWDAERFATVDYWKVLFSVHEFKGKMVKELKFAQLKNELHNGLAKESKQKQWTTEMAAVL